MPKLPAPFVRIAITNASEVALATSGRIEIWVAPLRATYAASRAAYAPYVSQTEKALRYGTMGMAAYAYAESKYQKYQEQGDAVWSEKLGADEIKLAGGIAGFSLGFIKVSSAIKSLGAFTGISSTASSAVAVASVTATKEAALGKDLAEVTLSSAGKVLEKYSSLGLKVVAKVEEVRSGFNPINHTPKATMKAGDALLTKYASTEAYRTSEEEGASMLSEATLKAITHIQSSMRQQLRSLRAESIIVSQEKLSTTDDVVQQSMKMEP